MKKGSTELVFILDRSGSMSGLEDDTVGGYNSMMDKQREVEGEVIVTTVLFDDKYELLHDRINFKDLIPMTREEYYVRGSTALIDAIGRTIKKVENAQTHIAEKSKADKVIFVITTDGYENASREFSAQQVKKMVEDKRLHSGWEFIFMGANIDAVETAKMYGVAESCAVNYHSDKKGEATRSRVLGETLCAMRKSEKALSSQEMMSCLSEIDEDYKKRRK